MRFGVPFGDTVGHLVTHDVVGARVARRRSTSASRSRTRSRTGSAGAGVAQAHGLGEGLTPPLMSLADQVGQVDADGCEEVGDRAAEVVGVVDVRDSRWPGRPRRAPRPLVHGDWSALGFSRALALSQTMRFGLVVVCRWSVRTRRSGRRRRPSALVGPRVSSNRHAVDAPRHASRSPPMRPGRGASGPASGPWRVHRVPATCRNAARAARRRPAPATVGRPGPWSRRHGRQDRGQLAVRPQADHDVTAEDRHAADLLLVAHDVATRGRHRGASRSVVPGLPAPSAAP